MVGKLGWDALCLLRHYVTSRENPEIKYVSSRNHWKLHGFWGVTPRATLYLFQGFPGSDSDTAVVIGFSGFHWKAFYYSGKPGSLSIDVSI